MTTITEKLAEALRLIAEHAGTRGDGAGMDSGWVEETARTTLAEYEAIKAGGPLPIGTRIRMLANRKFWKAGEVTELVSCEDWGDSAQSMDASGDYWARGIEVKIFCTGRGDFEVIGLERIA
jgi:hypothetical protein